jgi:hypothetical protein
MKPDALNAAFRAHAWPEEWPVVVQAVCELVLGLAGAR